MFCSPKARGVSGKSFIEKIKRIRKFIESLKELGHSIIECMEDVKKGKGGIVQGLTALTGFVSFIYFC